MATTILLIRHGETDWNALGRWMGHNDVPLNERGHQQASALARRLTAWPIEIIYSSDLRRAADTAAYLARALYLTPILDRSLRERNGGMFQGLTNDQILNRYPAALSKMRFDGAAPPNGESNLDLQRRVVPAFEAIIDNHEGQAVALFTHGGVLRLLIGHVLGLPADRRPNISVSGNTGLSIVEVDGDGPKLTLLNDTAHLTLEGLGSAAPVSE